MNKTYITVSLILAVSILGYAVINSMTKKSMQERELYEQRIETEAKELKEQQAKDDMQRKLNWCIADAEYNHWENWKLNCWDYTVVYDENGEIESCSVSEQNAKSLNNKLQNEKDNCIKRFGN